MTGERQPRAPWRAVSPARLVGMLCLVAALAAAVYAARLRSAADAGATPGPAASFPRLEAPPSKPYIMFSSMTRDEFKQVALTAPGAGEPGRFMTDLRCDRLYFAAGSGLCLDSQLEGLTTRYRARVFDAAFRTRATVALTGVPSRARVSSDGRRAAITVFEQGHSYAEAGFATRTTILDAASGAILGDLEQFTVYRENRPFKAVDFNFWGVTFAGDGNRFYATLATGGTPYLVEGNVDARTMRVLREGIECPSLSPDNRRLAFKQRVGQAGWRVDVLDLATGAVTPLSREARSVDDQVDWLDDGHVIYHVTGATGADVWSLATDGRQDPELLLPYAYSPSVVR